MLAHHHVSAAFSSMERLFTVCPHARPYVGITSDPVTRMAAHAAARGYRYYTALARNVPGSVAQAIELRILDRWFFDLANDRNGTSAVVPGREYLVYVLHSCSKFSG